MRLPYGPNWYAATMGTGIVAVVLPGLPFRVPGAMPVALGFWLAASLLLVATVTVMLRGIRRESSLLRRHYDDPVMSHFYGAPAMALMTVGAGAIGVGVDVLGARAAVGLAALLWVAGTLLGLWTAIAVPYRAITHHEVADDSATGGWLMPVVPPMVSATTGAALVPHLPAGQPRETFLLVCYALFGLTVIAGFLVLNQLWQRLIRHGALAPATLPTVWIVLGFLGQSTTAVHHLGALAPSVVPGYGHALSMLAVCYGVPAWGFTVLWSALALSLTVRQIRDGLPVAPTWWSFTFPIGTVATGSSALASATDLTIFEIGAGIATLGLVAGWLAAAYATLRLFVHPMVHTAERGGPLPSPRATEARAAAATCGG